MDQEVADSFKSKRLQRATVRVWSARPDQGGMLLGTAFFIAPRQALTAAHVLKDSATEFPLLQLSWMGGFYAAVSRVLYADAKVDAALLEINEEAAAPDDSIVTVAEAMPLTPGAPLLIAGFADAGSSLEIRPATVTGMDAIANARIIDPPPARGMSGGPALSPDGLLRGIIWARDLDKGRGYLTPLSALRPLLAQAGASTDNPPTRLLDNPALPEDRRRQSMARGLLLQWREQYAARLAELQAAAGEARTLQRSKGDPPYEEARNVADLALSVIEAMEALPIDELEFATHYGLGVHRSMFDSYALFIVRSAQARIEGDGAAERDEYAFEMMARTLESAIALLGFRPDSLPQGFIEPATAMDFEGVRAAPALLVGRELSIAGLELISMGQPPRIVGTLTARPPALHVDAARRMADGAIEILATDFQYRYRWLKDSAWPAAQYEHSSILFAAFPSSAPGSSPVVGGKDGAVVELYLDGSSHRLVEADATRKWIAGAVWNDPDEPEAIHVVHLANDGEMRSLRIGSEAQPVERNFAASLSNPADSGISTNLSEHNTRIDILNVEGFPCAVVTSHLGLGTTVLLFVDPKSLGPIRAMLRLPGNIMNCTVACGRWLIISHYGVREGQPLLTVYDFGQGVDAAAGELVYSGSDIADVPYTCVEAKAGGACLISFVRNLLYPADEHRLFRWSWPERTLEELPELAVASIFPVTDDR